jgi:16S rRNA (guanine527-N7)-methyltransferase
LTGVDERLEELAARYGLAGGTVAGLAALLGLLASDPHAPTSVCDPDRAVDAHIADSLTGLDVPAIREARTLADLGSGAGFPGIPLALALPDSEVILVESNGRKCAFLEAAAEASAAHNVRVARARAEEWEDGHGRCDVVLARALAPLAVIAEYAAPLLRVGGSAVAWKGRLDRAEREAAAAAAEILGLDAPSIQPVAPFPGAGERHLVVFPKRGPTPDRFPRRPGIARKRPLAGSVRAKSAK